MSSEGLHVPREKLRKETLHLHYAITSLIEELEAVDWYRQRADDTDDVELKAILLHNAKEEIEHASMALEWIRRNDPKMHEHLKTYLFTEGAVTAIEAAATGGGEDDEQEPEAPSKDGSLGIGSLRKTGGQDK